MVMTNGSTHHQQKNLIDLGKLSRDELVNSFVEIKLKEKIDENGQKDTNFLTVAETLTRIGIPSRHPDETTGKYTLYQSCHILSKFNRSRYFIVHFKELFALDDKKTNFTLDDLGRKNTIILLLLDWGLIDVVNLEKVKVPTVPMSSIKVIKYDDKENWVLSPKYKIWGSRK